MHRCIMPQSYGHMHICMWIDKEIWTCLSHHRPLLIWCNECRYISMDAICILFSLILEFIWHMHNTFIYMHICKYLWLCTIWFASESFAKQRLQPRFPMCFFVFVGAAAPFSVRSGSLWIFIIRHFVRTAFAKRYRAPTTRATHRNVERFAVMSVKI